MEYIEFADNLKFSRIAHGYWRLCDWGLSKNEVLNLFEACLDLGITTVDNADIYGNYTCEKLFGDALCLKPSLREKIQIITKCGIKLVSKNRPEHKIKHYDLSKEHIVKSVENSLKSMQTDYIDVLLIHRPSPFINPEEIADAFGGLKKQGKVLHFGVSNFNTSQFELLSSYLNFPLVTNQIEISPICLEHFDSGTIEQCQKYKIPPMAWSPLGGGQIFKGKAKREKDVYKTLEKIAKELNVQNIEQIAYAWLLAHPANIIPIVGSGNLNRIKSAVDAMQIKFSAEQWFEIWRSSTGKDVP